jgi:hypothetical protein
VPKKVEKKSLWVHAKKRVKKKGGQIKFKRNPIESAPPKKRKKKGSKTIPQVCPNKKRKCPKKKVTHLISPPIFCPDPQFWNFTPILGTLQIIKTGDEIKTGDGTGEDFLDNFNSFFSLRPDLQQAITSTTT